MSTSLGTLMLQAGARAAQWSVDTGDCFFCETTAEGAHEDYCTFQGMSREELAKATQIMSILGHDVE